MTPTSTTAEDRLAKLGIPLPDAPTTFGAYVPAIQTGNLLFLSGMLATSGQATTVAGIVGKDLAVEAGQEAAYAAALNGLALTKKQLGSLDRVNRVVRLRVSLAATAEFTEHPKVADVASELLRDVFGGPESHPAGVDRPPQPRPDPSRVPPPPGAAGRRWRAAAPGS